MIPDSEEYTKTLGIEWNAESDHFRLTVSKIPDLKDIAKVYDVLGWFSPCVIKVKILLQKVWERKISWDDEVSPDILETWIKWRSELTCLPNKLIPRCYFPHDFSVTSTELHGFVMLQNWHMRQWRISGSLTPVDVSKPHSSPPRLRWRHLSV